MTETHEPVGGVTAAPGWHVEFRTPSSATIIDKNVFFAVCKVTDDGEEEDNEVHPYIFDGSIGLACAHQEEYFDRLVPPEPVSEVKCDNVQG